MNTLKVTFLMTFLTVIAVKVGKTLGGAEGALIALVIALIVHVINYWFSDKIILRMHGAKEIQPDGVPGLCHLVQELTCRAQMPMPKFYLLPGRTATAIATGRDEKHAAVAVTGGIQNPEKTKPPRMLAREMSPPHKRDRLGGKIPAQVAGGQFLLVGIGQ